MELRTVMISEWFSLQKAKISAKRRKSTTQSVMTPPTPSAPERAKPTVSTRVRPNDVIVIHLGKEIEPSHNGLHFGQGRLLQRSLSSSLSQFIHETQAGEIWNELFQYDSEDWDALQEYPVQRKGSGRYMMDQHLPSRSIDTIGSKAMC